MHAIELWKTLCARASAVDIADAASVTPAALTWARRADHPRGAALPELPTSYRAFIQGVGGYPMFGLGYYDRQGFSFLPPSPMAVLSVGTFDADGNEPRRQEDAPTACPFALFAGYDLSDIEGWAFGPDGQVWTVERAMAYTPVGDFETWICATLEQSLARLDTDPETLAGHREAVAAETDPHRLYDYSIEGYPIGQRTPADRALHWVCRQSGSPYEYGLIDDAGAWRIPMCRRFKSVRPVTGGVAKVVPAGARWDAPDRWISITPDGASAQH